MLVISVLKRLRQQSHKFKASLGYRASQKNITKNMVFPGHSLYINYYPINIFPEIFQIFIHLTASITVNFTPPNSKYKNTQTDWDCGWFTFIHSNFHSYSTCTHFTPENQLLNIQFASKSLNGYLGIGHSGHIYTSEIDKYFLSQMFLLFILPLYHNFILSVFTSLSLQFKRSWGKLNLGINLKAEIIHQ